MDLFKFFWISSNTKGRLQLRNSAELKYTSKDIEVDFKWSQKLHRQYWIIWNISECDHLSRDYLILFGIDEMLNGWSWSKKRGTSIRASRECLDSILFWMQRPDSIPHRDIEKLLDKSQYLAHSQFIHFRGMLGYIHPYVLSFIFSSLSWLDAFHISNSGCWMYQN